jgi:Holliday junction resolvasome RuvABC DNA-binding subunit
MNKFAKETSAQKVPKLASGDEYQTIVTCLKEQMGYTKVKAEEAGEYVMQKIHKETLENKIKLALNYLGG